MSSHHIIRDNQEAAVFISSFHQEQLPTLDGALEWSPIVVATEATFQELNRMGKKIDVLICERTFVNVNSRIIQLQHPLEIIYTSDQSPILQLGITCLIKKKTPGIYLFSDISVKEFITLCNHHIDIPIVLFNNGIRYSMIKKTNFEKWYAPGTEIHLIKSSENEEIRITYPDRKSMLAITEAHSIFILTDEGLYQISGEKPFVLGEKI